MPVGWGDSFRKYAKKKNVMQTDQDKIKVVIVDDEPQSILRLENDLAALDDFEVIATSSSAMSAKT